MTLGSCGAREAGSVAEAFAPKSAVPHKAAVDLRKSRRELGVNSMVGLIRREEAQTTNMRMCYAELQVR